MELFLRAGTLLVALTWLGSAQAQDDWTTRYPIYGCGDFEGEAYRDAERKVNARHAQAERRCELQGGLYSSRNERGLCTPFRPNDLFCRVDCLVVGYGQCTSAPKHFIEEVVFTELDGNDNGVFETGETLNARITVNNVSRRKMDEVFVDVENVDDRPSLFAMGETGMFLGEIAAGETSSGDFNIAIRDSAECGKIGGLEFTITIDGKVVRFRRYLGIGGIGEPVTVGEDDVRWSFPREGENFPINVETTDAPLQSAQLKYTMRVTEPSKYRAWLSSPLPTQFATWAHWVDERRTNIEFSRDVTRFLIKDGAMANGEWNLSGDYTGEGSATITSYELTVTPAVFDCK